MYKLQPRLFTKRKSEEFVVHKPSLKENQTAGKQYTSGIMMLNMG